MNSNTHLPHQPNTPQQPPLVEKKGNHSWKAFSIILVIFNFPFVAGLIVGLIAGLIFELQFWQGLEYMISGFIQSMITWSFYIVPLAIVDLIAVRSYSKKRLLRG